MTRPVTKRKLQEAQQAAAANTFRAVGESYFNSENGGKNLRSKEWQCRLLERLVYPTLGNQPITTIKRKAINALLGKVEDSSGATMAHRRWPPSARS